MSFVRFWLLFPWDMRQCLLFINNYSNEEKTSSFVHCLYLQILFIIGVEQLVVVALIVFMDVALIHIDDPSRRVLVHWRHELHILITLPYVLISQLLVIHTLLLLPLVSKSRKIILHRLQRRFYILLVLLVDHDEATSIREVHDIFCYCPLANFSPFPEKVMDYNSKQTSSSSSCAIQMVVSFWIRNI